MYTLYKYFISNKISNKQCIHYINIILLIKLVINSV